MIGCRRCRQRHWQYERMEDYCRRLDARIEELIHPPDTYQVNVRCDNCYAEHQAPIQRGQTFDAAKPTLVCPTCGCKDTVERLLNLLRMTPTVSATGYTAGLGQPLAPHPASRWLQDEGQRSIADVLGLGWGRQR